MGLSDTKLLQEAQEALSYSKFLRYGHERDWYRNLLYKQGHQWIVWDEVARRFRAKQLASWIPTPVTNLYASTLDTLLSLILKVEHPMVWAPVDSSDELQKTTSETATKVVDRVQEQVYFNELRQPLGSWFVYTGNAYLVNCYDNKSGADITVPLSMCGQCQYEGLPSEFEQGCPQCGVTGMQQLAMNEMGMPKEETFKGGEIRTEVAAPFEMFFDFQNVLWRDNHYFIRQKQRPLSYFKKHYGKKRADKVLPEHGHTLSEFYQSTLPYLSSGTGISSSAVLASKEPYATEMLYQRLPDDDEPEGVYAVFAGQELLFRDKLYTRDLSGKKVLSATHFSFDIAPGSAIGKTVGNDLAPKQKQLNELESLIQLTTMRMGNPVWIVPYGVDVEEFSGEPGAVLKVYQLTPNNANEPKRLPGENIPSSIMAWREMIKKEFEEMAGTFAAMKGEVPPGVEAGYAIQLLIERGQGKWAPTFSRWVNGHLEWARQVTSLARDYMPSDQLLMLLGENGEWELEHFKHDKDLGIVLKMEEGSVRPKSELQEQAQIDSAMAKHLIDPLNPVTKSLILRVLGLSKYDQDSDEDQKDARKEEDDFKEIVKEVPVPDPMSAQAAWRPRPTLDNHFVHAWSHRRYFKTDAFRKLSPAWQTIALQHLDYHNMQIAAMQQVMAPPPGKGGPGEKPGAPPGNPQGNGGSGEQPDQLAASDKGGKIENPMKAGTSF